MKLIPVVLSVALFSGLVQGAEAPVKKWRYVNHNIAYMEGTAKNARESFELGVFLDPKTCEPNGLAFMVDVRYDMEASAEMIGTTPEALYKQAAIADGNKVLTKVNNLEHEDVLIGKVLVSDPYAGTTFEDDTRSFKILAKYLLEGKTIYITKHGEEQPSYQVNPTGFEQAIKQTMKTCVKHTGIGASSPAAVPTTGQVM